MEQILIEFVNKDVSNLICEFVEEAPEQFADRLESKLSNGRYQFRMISIEVWKTTPHMLMSKIYIDRSRTYVCCNSYNCDECKNLQWTPCVKRYGPHDIAHFRNFYL